MKITDEMVERATEAIKDRARRGAIKYTNGKITVMDIDIARAALTAALGDVEPLEDVVMGGDWTVTMLEPDPQLNQFYAEVNRYYFGDDTAVSGSANAPTIDAAIRAAVANAKGEQE